MNMRLNAIKAAGHVICTLTIFPSLIELLMLSFCIKLVERDEDGGGNTFPPYTNLIKRSTSCNSLLQTLPFPRLINPKAMPAASE